MVMAMALMVAMVVVGGQNEVCLLDGRLGDLLGWLAGWAWVEDEGGSGPCRLLQRSTRWTLDDGVSSFWA